MTRDVGDSGDRRAPRAPAPYFSISIANKAPYPTRPLHGAWVALAWPLGGPRVAQASPKPNPKQAEGRKPLLVASS